MKKGFIRKGLVFSIIILVIGIAIQPVFASEVSITTKSDNEDCIDCQVIDRYIHLKVNLLLTRIKTINKIASLISGNDEELKHI